MLPQRANLAKEHPIFSNLYETRNPTNKEGFHSIHVKRVDDDEYQQYHTAQGGTITRGLQVNQNHQSFQN